MKIIFTSFLYLLLIIPLSNSEVNKEHYQRQFRLKSFGSLTSAYNVLFSSDGGSFPAALSKCTKFCRGDKRCIGMEVCQIREYGYRCRACCEWMKLGEKAELTNDMAACKYYEMNEETMNIAVSQPATLSSTYSNANYIASNAVDDVLECSSSLLIACTQLEFQPWLKIDLQAIYDINKVTIYNRQDCCGKYFMVSMDQCLRWYYTTGERLHDVQVNIMNNGTEASCGFYKGPTDIGDRISVYCASGAVGRYVLMTILNQPGKAEYLNVCEVQVFVDV